MTLKVFYIAPCYRFYGGKIMIDLHLVNAVEIARD